MTAAEIDAMPEDTAAQRLKKVRSRLYETAADAARALQMTEGNYRHYENGTRELSGNYAIRFGKKFGVPPDYLLEGKKRSPKLRLVESFDPDGGDTHTEEAATIGAETGVRGIPDDTSPQLDLTGGLGSGGIAIVSEGVPGKHGMTFAAEQIRDYWRLPPAILVTLGLSSHDVAIIPVQGDSMLPALNEGDVVFIDTRHRLPSPAGLYALLDEIGGVVIKRIEIASPPGAEQQIISIISDNPRHARKEWRAEDVQILGRVLRKFGTIG